MPRRLPILLAAVAFSLSFLAILKSSDSRPGWRERESHEGRSGAMAALEFWTRSRAYPDNDIPPDKFYRSYQMEKMNRKEISRRISGASIWNPIGPANLQGRAISVAINPLNPKTVYVGSASGGLWRSYTGGLTADWQQMLFGYPARGIGAIAIDPTDSNIIYVGTGEVYRYQGSFGGQVVRTTRGSYGIGILKTTDGGATWSKSLDWSLNQETGIQRLAINPLNHRTIYAATSEGIYKSTDAGGTWSNILTIFLGEDVVINPLDTNKVLVSCGDLGMGGTGLYRSTDAGANWSTVSGIPTYLGKTLLEMYGANPNTVFASVGIDSVTDHGALYRSRDFGNTWSLVYDQNGTGLFQVQGWYSHFVAVKPNDSTQIVHAAVPVYKSTNGGSSWFGSGGGYSDNHSYAHDPTDPNILYVVNDDGVYRSTDFGSSFTNVGTGMITGQFYNGFSSSYQDSLVAIGQSQDHIPGYRYLGSMTWDHASVVDEVGWTAINPANDNIMYAGNRFGSDLYKSTNRGVSFNFLIGFAGSGAWNSPFVVSAANPNILYFGDQYVHKSTSAGGSWALMNAGNPLDGDPSLSMAIGTTSPDTVFIGTAPMTTSAHVFRTTNGGTSWTDVTGIMPDRYPMDLAVDPTNSRIVYCVFGGFGSGHVYKSTNAGTSWSNITGTLPDVPTTAVVVDSLHPNVVYIGNDLGVYVSADTGVTWSGFSEGFPDAVIIADLSISPSNRVLRAVTHGNGVYERKLLYELPANYFDYRVLALNSPSDGQQVNTGVSIPIIASFRNLSAQAQTDSFDVKYRILDGSTEIYSSTERIRGLGLGETRQVTFSPPFTATTPQVLTVEAINLASDQDHTNDTLAGTLVVLQAPDLENFVVQKSSCPYTEIAGGSAGPAGDDVQLGVPLPFVFTYDGHAYDSAQISTNGWLEFGTGPQGSVYGLSTAAQLTGYFRPDVLGTTDRPTKALGVWWADIATGTTGQITYTTLGSQPNRTFVVQWKNVPAFYDQNQTSVTINFQLRLHETTNEVEYDYGAVSGSSGVMSGASIGLKDYIGGDYRFYDIAAGGIGTLGTLVSSLTPLSGWPGQDSCYHITTNAQGLTVSLLAGWNMVSNPVTRQDKSDHAIFPSILGSAFSYNGGYQLADSLFPGTGYWIKVPSLASQFIKGGPLDSIVVAVNSGWNMIGSVDHIVSAPSGGSVIGSVFEYSSGGYNAVTQLVPGNGYWVKTNSAGTLTLGPAAAPKARRTNFDAYSSITIADRSGRKQTLYLAPEAQAGSDLAVYAMPPLPPAGAFDARYASGRILEAYPTDIREDRTYPISVQSPVYPLTVSYDLKTDGGKGFYLDESHDGVRTPHALGSSGSVILAGGEGDAIAIRISGTAGVPAVYALRQNYPNPFNPATSIRFDLPAKSSVTLQVFDILGREVMTLARGEYEAGSYTVRADFSDRASGVYLYRIQVSNPSAGPGNRFTDVKKLVVTK